MIDENELIKSLEDLTNEYRDKQANAKNEKHNACLTGALGILIDVTNMVRHWPKRRNRMTNLEYYKDQVVELFRGDLICNQIEEINKYRDCKECPFNTNDKNTYCDYHKFIDWLLEEHKEPIKLKQWEKDLLKLHEYNQRFCNYTALFGMKHQGYFKCVENESMTIKEILDNCEVIDK